MNFGPLTGGADIWLKQVAGVLTGEFRQMIRDLLARVLEATPQWSGKAVANWNVSIGEPDYSWNDSYGDYIQWGDDAHARGDKRWINEARVRNERVISTIRYRDRVHLTNGVSGDAGSYMRSDKSLEYIDAIQVPGLWRDKLREVNAPYETLLESMIIVSTQYQSKGLVLPRSGKGFFLGRNLKGEFRP